MTFNTGYKSDKIVFFLQSSTPACKMISGSHENVGGGGKLRQHGGEHLKIIGQMKESTNDDDDVIQIINLF